MYESSCLTGKVMWYISWLGKWRRKTWWKREVDYINMSSPYICWPFLKYPQWSWTHCSIFSINDTAHKFMDWLLQHSSFLKFIFVPSCNFLGTHFQRYTNIFKVSTHWITKPYIIILFAYGFLKFSIHILTFSFLCSFLANKHECK